MNDRMRITFGLLATLIGFVGMAVIWIGAGPQSFVGFMAGFAVAVGGAYTAASGFKHRNAVKPSAGEQDAQREKPRLGAMGLVFAVIGGLLMVFCGGCTLLSVLGEAGGSGFAAGAGAALVFGGFPFAIGFVIWLLAMSSRKPREVLDTGGQDGNSRS